MLREIIRAGGRIGAEGCFDSNRCRQARPGTEALGTAAASALWERPSVRPRSNGGALGPAPPRSERTLPNDGQRSVAGSRSQRAPEPPYLFYGRVPYELGEERVVRALVRAGEHVVDVGANVGWYSTMLAELVGLNGRVYAFEPNTDLVRSLTLTALEYPSLRVIAAAVGEA